MRRMLMAWLRLRSIFSSWLHTRRMRMACIAMTILAVGLGWLGVNSFGDASGCYSYTPSYSYSSSYSYKPYYYEKPVYYEKVINQPILVPALTFQYLPAVGIQTIAPVPQANQQQQAPAPAAPAPAPAPPRPQAAPDTLDTLPSAATAAIAPAVQPNRPNQDFATAPSSGDGLEAAIQAMKTKCASCHTGTTSDGNLPLFLDGGTFNTGLSKYQKAYIVQLSDDASMPPSAKGDPTHSSAMTDAEIKAIKQAFARRRN